MGRVNLEHPEEGIVFLRLNDPDRQNRLTAELVAECAVALRQLAAEKSVRALVICGLPSVFCSGSGLEELKQIAAGSLMVRDLSLPHQLLEFPVPTIAAMEGHAVGGGFVLALLCDVVVAANEMRFGLNFTDLGLTPGMGSTRLVAELVGHHFAAEMIFTSRFFRGEELAKRGLFNAAVPSSEVLSKALDIAREISAKPRHVLQLTKSAMGLARRTSLIEAISQEHLMHELCRYEPETLARIEANYLS